MEEENSFKGSHLFNYFFWLESLRNDEKVKVYPYVYQDVSMFSKIINFIVLKFVTFMHNYV